VTDIEALTIALAQEAARRVRAEAMATNLLAENKRMAAALGDWGKAHPEGLATGPRAVEGVDG